MLGFNWRMYCFFIPSLYRGALDRRILFEAQILVLGILTVAGFRCDEY